MVSEGAPPVAEEATERSAAVDKIEETRKPDDFIGYRKRRVKYGNQRKVPGAGDQGSL